MKSEKIICILFIIVTAFAQADDQVDGPSSDRSVVDYELGTVFQSGPVLSGAAEAELGIWIGDARISTALGTEVGRAEIEDEKIEFNTKSASLGLIYPNLFPGPKLGFMAQLGYSTVHEGYGNSSVEDGEWSVLGSILWMPIQGMIVSAGAIWNSENTWVLPLAGFNWYTGRWMICLSAPGGFQLNYMIHPVFSPGVFAEFNGISIPRKSTDEDDAEITVVRTGVDFRFSFGDHCSAFLRSGTAVDLDEKDLYFFNALGLTLVY